MGWDVLLSTGKGGGCKDLYVVGVGEGEEDSYLAAAPIVYLPTPL